MENETKGRVENKKKEEKNEDKRQGRQGGQKCIEEEKDKRRVKAREVIENRKKEG